MRVRASMFSRRPGLHLSACILIALNVNAIAAEPIVGPPIRIGQTGVATPDPYVPVPPTKPCVVSLYTARSATGTFDDYANHAFQYAPPACHGPWNKIVFKADFNVTTGTQFDRTAALWIGGVNLYFGTTQEPRATVSPSWHVERDVTDLAAALAGAHPGNVAVYNIYNETYNGSITGSAEIDFYPATSSYPATQVPDLVLPMVSDPAGTYAYINTDGDPLAQSFTLPKNIERAYLAVTAEPQSGDEFWYSCGPDAYIALTGCGGTGFRETEIAVDGEQAGIAPVSGWVYTGGIDPYLWRPIPGVQTLSFLPYRVDLTPFVALLDNGQAHTIAVRVVTGDPQFQNNSQYFATAANLLLYLDHGSAQVTGQLPSVSDSGVHPSVQSSASGDGTQVKFNVVSRHTLNTSGSANTSHGVVSTNVQQLVNFGNYQTVISTNTQFLQDINQTSAAQSTSSYSDGTSAGTMVDVRNWSFPLRMDIDYVVADDGTSAQTTSASQGFTLATSQRGPNGVLTTVRVQNSAPSDTLNFDADGNFTGPTGQKSTESYYYRDSSGSCYSRGISATAGAVTAVKDGLGCGGQ